MPGPYTGAYYSGKDCSVLRDGVYIACGEWEATKATETFELTTGRSSPAKEAGLGNYEITGRFTGPVDGAVVNPFPANVPVLLTLYPGSGATPLVGYGLLHSIQASTKTSDAFKFNVQFKSTGPWTGI